MAANASRLREAHDAGLAAGAGIRNDARMIKHPPAHPDLVVATYNVQKGIGTDLRRDARRTERVISALGADIVAVQEGDRRFGNRAGVLDLAVLRASSGLVPVPVAAPLGALAHGWHGNLLLVRAAAVESVRGLHLPGAEPRGALIVDLDLAQFGPVRVIAVHLALLARARRAQARMLAEVAAEAQERDGRPTIVMGDMNEWRRWPSPALAALDHHLGAPGLAPSFPAIFPRLPLDRIYASKGFDMLSVAAHDTALARRASDHLPVVARLRPRGRD